MPAESVLTLAEVVERVARAFETVGAEYAVGGSVASSLYGEPRSTNDVDFAFRMDVEQVARWIDALGPDFDVDEEALRDAIRQGRSWNIFYLPLMLRIDLFARGRSPFDDSEFARRTAIGLAPGTRPIQLSSPEDNLLWKLRWFKMGGEVSDRQWRDVLGIVRVSGPTLDRAYLERWARELGVTSLLKRAFGGEPRRPKRSRRRK